MNTEVSPEIIRLIRKEINRALSVILSCATGETTAETETIRTLYPGMNDIPARPVMHPYGLASRAPRGIINVVTKMGENPGNRMVLGHRDKDRPPCEEGEVVLYNQYGQQIYLENGKVHIGRKSAKNHAVLGDDLKELLQKMLDTLIKHTHVTSGPGSATSVPIQFAEFQVEKADYVDNDRILSDYIFLNKIAGSDEK